MKKLMLAIMGMMLLSGIVWASVEYSTNPDGTLTAKEILDDTEKADRAVQIDADLVTLQARKTNLEKALADVNKLILSKQKEKASLSAPK